MNGLGVAGVTVVTVTVGDTVVTVKAAEVPVTEVEVTVAEEATPKLHPAPVPPEESSFRAKKS